jgi:hypothetical protein
MSSKSSSKSQIDEEVALELSDVVMKMLLNRETLNQRHSPPQQDLTEDEMAQKVRLCVLMGECCSEEERFLIWRSPRTRMLVFVSSTFTDTHLERNILLDQILPSLRLEGEPCGIDISLVDMRYGVRDESTLHHSTWHDCLRELKRCSKESAGVSFLSLQSHKYGYRPLPKSISKDKFDELLLTHSFSSQEEAALLAREWYVLDKNSVPEKYVLQDLTVNSDNKTYWDRVLPMLRPLMASLCFDEEHCGSSVMVGSSITECEIQYILNGGGSLRTSRWVHRHFESDVTAAQDPQGDLSDTQQSDAGVQGKLDALIDVMKERFSLVNDTSIATVNGDMAPPASPSYVTCPISVEHYLAEEDDPDKVAYKDLWRRCVQDMLMTDLHSVAARHDGWLADGGGIGLSGSALSDILHHSEWARTKCLTFSGRFGVVNRALRCIYTSVAHSFEPVKKSSLVSTIEASNANAVAENCDNDAEYIAYELKSPSFSDGIKSNSSANLYGIYFALVGKSGQGKTALMSKLVSLCYEQEFFKPLHQRRPVLVRFCGINGASSSGEMLARSICEQMILLVKQGLLRSNAMIYKLITAGGCKITASENFDCEEIGVMDNGDVFEINYRTILKTNGKFRGQLMNGNGWVTLMLADSLEMFVEVVDYGKEVIPSGASYAHVTKLLHNLLQTYPVILFIDGLDQLSNDQMERSRLSFLEGLTPHEDTRLIVSTLPDEKDSMGKSVPQKYFGCESRLKEALVPCITLESFNSTTEVKVLLGNILLQNQRTVTSEQWNSISGKISKHCSALYLNLAARIMTEWKSTDVALDLPPTVSALVTKIIDDLEIRFGDVMTKAALGYITFAMSGVNDREIEDLLSLDERVLDSVFQYSEPGIRRFPSHVWIRLRAALGGLLVEREFGCAVWYHRQLREVIAQRYSEPEVQELRRNMGVYFGMLDITPDVVAEKRLSDQSLCLKSIDSSSKEPSVWLKGANVNHRRCAEAVPHLIHSKIYVEAVRELCDLSSIYAHVKCGEGYNLVRHMSHVNDLLTEIMFSDQCCDYPWATADLALVLYQYMRWLTKNISIVADNPTNLLCTCSLEPLISQVRKDVYGLLEDTATSRYLHFHFHVCVVQ